MGSEQDEQLPAELRGEPAVEPTVEVDEDVRIPPEAGVTVVTHPKGPDRPGPDAAFDDPTA